jgi:uncharacterized repeat protein (TIGR01451 family)
VAGGAYAAGAEELNYYSPSTYGILDGNVSWDDWGGTSRSSPVALGIYALLAQAYKDKHGIWPTAAQGKALMMSSATDIDYDVFRQGAGSLNADTGTAIASGEYGVMMDADSATWEPGGYRGTTYDYFAHIVEPGDTWNKTFTVVNDGPTAVDVDISDVYLKRIGDKEFPFTVTSAMVAAETGDNFYNGFHYFIPITAEAGFDPSWYNVAIPDDTELMCVRMIFPQEEFDVDGDYAWDNRFYLVVYNWQDENNNGIVWDDKDGNGVVNFDNAPDLGTDGLKASPELLWDDPDNEIDQWEFGRFGYNRPSGNSTEVCVQNPLERMQDGLFIGPRHHPGSTYSGDTHLNFLIEFYKKADVDWLSTDVTNLNVPAGGTATFQGTVNVPANMPAGDYQAAIQVTDPGPVGGEPNDIVVPVVLNVAADFDDLYAGETLAGWAGYAYDANKGQKYNNAAVRGYQEWGWREETGDWRFFYVDIDNEPAVTTIWSEGFEDVTFPPTGWSNYTFSGVGFVQDATQAHGGTYSAFYDDAMGTQEGWLVTPQFTPGGAQTELAFWQYQNYDSFYTYHGIWVSDGSGDPNDGDFVELTELGPGAEDAWEEVRLSLAAYAGTPIYVAFVYGGDFSDEWWIDDAGVADAAYPYDPTAHVIIRDQWEDPAPWTDIDTKVLGPSPTRMSYVNFGTWATNGYNPALYGPYTLDPVASSVLDQVGRSTWRFNTSSGGNEDWIALTINDGLHEILQQNVLFEGNKHSVVFTKTVGLLEEDVHSLHLDTYLDEGVVGTVTLNSSLGLNGLLAEGYLGDFDVAEWTNEPIGFGGSGSIEWTNVFQVQNGVSIEAWTSSADIADIDLYLYYYGAGGWTQRAVSGGSDSNEYIMLTGPEDGFWLVGVNNYSGPAGHFNLTRVVASKAGGITITGLPVGNVPAHTDVPLTIHFEKELDAGITYPGVVLVGPPEAPELKEIPFTITKLPQDSDVAKMVNSDVFYPGSNLAYTIDLFNMHDADADFEFVDPIPANTEFVAVTGATYNAIDNQIEFAGKLPMGVKPEAEEGFEAGVMPPGGWDVADLSGRCRLGHLRRGHLSRPRPQR